MSKKLTRRGGGVLNRLDKNYPLFIHNLGYKFFACLATLVFILSTILLAFPELTNQKATDAFRDASPDSYPINTYAATVGEIWNGTSFDENNLNTLLKYVSGSETISTKDLSVLNNDTENINELKGITAEMMRASTAAGKEEGKDIVVTFGGLTWTPTYLSKTKPNEKNENGDLILTLWLADSAQLSGGTYDEGAGEKFTASGIASWYAGTSSAAGKPTDEYPDNMYGTSYMNAVVLNNGGYYKRGYSVDEVTKVEKNPNHVFSLFTTDEKLTKYIVTPSEVTWQEYGQDKRLNSDNTLTNENWSETINKNGTIEGDPTGTDYKFNGNYNYASKKYSNQWSTSTLWLPSMSETGYSDAKEGIWQTSTAQRSNTADSWLRSGFYNNAYCAYYLYPSGSNCSYINLIRVSAVRPALHLNLNKATEKPSFADDVAEYDQNDPTNEAFKDIYKITRETGIDFHIKTAAGFLKLSEATAAGQSFDPSWTFYLDEDITVEADDSYTLIGSEANPFLGTFDGQNHTLNFTHISTGSEEVSIFGDVGTSSFKNMVINENLSYKNYLVYALILRQRMDAVCTLSNLTFTGNIEAMVFEGIVGENYCTAYQVKMNYSNITTEIVCFFSGDFNINSCSVDCENISTTQLYVVFGNANVNGLKVNLRSVSTVSMAFFGSESSSGHKYNLQECEMNANIVEVKESEINNYFVLFMKIAGSTQVNMHDCAFSCANLEIRFAYEGAQDSTEHYDGAYIHDSQTNKTTILDPNFTSYKWRIDTSNPNALPVLADYNHVGSNRNPNMESLDMKKWASEKSKA